MTRLPVGFERFHRQRFIDYQLNRAHALGYVERVGSPTGSDMDAALDELLRGDGPDDAGSGDSGSGHGR